MLDGVYDTSADEPVFHPVRVPTAEQLQTLLNQIIKRVMKLLTRLGYLVEEQDMIFMAETDTDAAMAPLQSAACTYRIAFGPRAGQKVVSLQSVPSSEAQPPQQLCANAQGFSLHAEVRCAMNQRNKLEQLCRYITRPAIANERLKLNRTGDVVLKLKSPYRDGTTHIVMTPLEFMQRLAALVPRPRLNLIRVHGLECPASVAVMDNGEAILGATSVRQTSPSPNILFGRSASCEVTLSHLGLASPQC